MEQPHANDDQLNRPRGNRPAKGARVVTPGELVQGALGHPPEDGDFLGLGASTSELMGMANELAANERAEAEAARPLLLAGESDDEQPSELEHFDEFEPADEQPEPLDIYARGGAHVDPSARRGSFAAGDGEGDEEILEVSTDDEWEQSEDGEADGYAPGEGEFQAEEAEQFEDEREGEEDECEPSAAEFYGELDSVEGSEGGELEGDGFGDAEADPSEVDTFGAEEGGFADGEAELEGVARQPRRGVRLLVGGAAFLSLCTLAVVTPARQYLPASVEARIQALFDRGPSSEAAGGARVTRAGTASAQASAKTPAAPESGAEEAPGARAEASGDRSAERSARSVAEGAQAPALPLVSGKEAPSAPAAGVGPSADGPAVAAVGPSGALPEPTVPSEPAPAATLPANTQGAEPAPLAQAEVAANGGGTAPKGPLPAGPEVPPLAEPSLGEGIATVSAEGQVVPLERETPRPSLPSVRLPSAEELRSRWPSEEVPPLERIAGKDRVYTPNVGRVRVLTQRGDVFDGRLDALGEGQVWIETHLGAMVLSGEQVARIDRLPNAPGANPKGGPVATGQRVRVKTPGGVIVGRILSREENRVTILTDGGGRITLVNPEIEPADQRLPGGTLGGERRP